MAPLAVLLPRRCAVCGVPGAGLCSRCRRGLVRVVPPLCARCGAPGPWPLRRCVECMGRRLAFASARSALVYETRARSFVSAWKERGRRDLAALAAELLVESVPRAPAATLVPVPADRDRTLRRGTSTAAALAHALARAWGSESTALLARSDRRPSSRQRGLTLAQRRANVRGAFVARGTAPSGVCLVDDVYTTGSTAGACAAALRRAGAERVDVVTLARALRGG